jgi:two-component system, OmpR family, phosphate regulon response regulator PhoB
MGQSILIIEDEPQIADLIELTLSPLQLNCKKVSSVESAEEKIHHESFSLILIDWMLPKKQGIEFLADLNQNSAFKKTQKMMITAKGDSDSIVLALESGADDYVVKPFVPDILLARVKNLLRRHQLMSEKNDFVDDDRIELFGLTMDFGKVEVKLSTHGQPEQSIHLTPSEFKLLGFLLKSRGKVLSRDQLIDLIQGHDVTVTGRTIDTHVFALRKKLGAWSDHIETIRGVGYRVHYSDSVP